MDSDAFSLRVEGHTVFTCDTFLECVIGLIASIYCLNLVYPKELEKTLTFIQNVVLGLKDGDRNIDKRIVSVLTELNKEKQKKSIR